MPRRVDVGLAKEPRDIRDRFALQVPLHGSASAQSGKSKPERFQTELRDDRVKLTTKTVRLQPDHAIITAPPEHMRPDDINELRIVDHDMMRTFRAPTSRRFVFSDRNHDQVVPTRR